MSCGNTGNSAFDCQTELLRLYNIYQRLITGRSVVEQQDGDYRRVEFRPGDADKVLRQYNLLYQQCGAGSGLPDLAAGQSASVNRRGPPIPFHVV